MGSSQLFLSRACSASSSGVSPQNKGPPRSCGGPSRQNLGWRLARCGCQPSRSSALPASDFATLRRKRSTRPAVSTSFCLPVKNGWQAEQISTTEYRPCAWSASQTALPHAHLTLVTSIHPGGFFSFGICDSCLFWRCCLPARGSLANGSNFTVTSICLSRRPQSPGLQSAETRSAQSY